MRISDWSSDVCSSDLHRPPRSAVRLRSGRNGCARSCRRDSARRARCAASWNSRHVPPTQMRSEEHTSELQPLMRISYAVFCLKKKTNTPHQHNASNIVNIRNDHTLSNYHNTTTTLL